MSNYPLSERIRSIFKDHAINDEQLEQKLKEVIQKDQLSDAIAKELIEALNLKPEQQERPSDLMYPSLKKAKVIASPATNSSMSDLLYPSMKK